MEKVLNLVLRPQETGMWCWAASGQMCMEFVGRRTIAQCLQANNRFGLIVCCTTPVPGVCVVGGWPEFSKYGFTFKRTSNRALTWAELVAEIDANRPIAFSWHWPGGGGHMMVAYGYSDETGVQMVYVADPWAPDVGNTRIITYSHFVSSPGHTHWDDFYEIVYPVRKVRP
ncbi:MAG TPA: papain-like cysteine protease family protein, partial [Fimbriimonadaceae bacterium]|nr:papain-like cysteine protease family protein [Fimbriimonadaceae bacterium]